jgi:alanine racemase
MTRPACVVVDRQAARANLARVRKLVPHRKIMAIIKADAYGHGLLRMAEPLADADAFGVACLEEA